MTAGDTASSVAVGGQVGPAGQVGSAGPAGSAGLTGPAALRCRGLRVGHCGARVLDGVDLEVPPGRTVALLGASGSGKTTLLHAVAGFLAPMAGSIELAGRVVAGDGRCLPPEHRDLGVVFQSAALWPHLSALDNVAYPLRRNGYGRQAAQAEALRLLGQLHLARLAARRPTELSGGEQQRVGLARALARQAGLFLFDEPTAHLDAHLRDVFLEEIARQRAARGTAALLATHDAAEALAVADLVAVLDDGGLAQVGTPREVYQRPATLTVARLTGPVSVLDDGLGRTVVRPDWVLLGAGDASAVLVAVRFRGPFTDYLLRTPRGTLVAREPGPPRHEPDDPISYTLTRTWSVARR